MKVEVRELRRLDVVWGEETKSWCGWVGAVWCDWG